MGPIELLHERLDRMEDKIDRLLESHFTEAGKKTIVLIIVTGFITILFQVAIAIYQKV